MELRLVVRVNEAKVARQPDVLDVVGGVGSTGELGEFLEFGELDEGNADVVTVEDQMNSLGEDREDPTEEGNGVDLAEVVWLGHRSGFWR